MRFAAGLMIVVTLGALGCKKKPPPSDDKPAEKSEPVYVFLKFKAAKVDGALDVSCDGDLCDSKQLPMTRDGALSVKLTNCEGCTVEIAGKTIEVDEDKKVTIDLVNAIGDNEAKNVEGLNRLQIPVKTTPPKGEAPEPKMLELLGSVPAAIVLGRVTEGPVTFKKDKAVDEPASAIIVREDANYGVVTKVGSAKRVRDFDLVGVATASYKELGSCGTYKKDGTDEKVEVKMKGLNLDITMYDRRTGKSLGKKTFASQKPDCHSELVAGTTYLLGRPSDDAIATWTKSFFK
jgi:hypothetical protein